MDSVDAPEDRSRPMARAILSALDQVNAAVGVVAGLLLGIATLSVTGQVLIRFALNIGGLNVSAPWTEELSRFCIIWAVFLGVAVISRQAGLIAVEMLPQLLARPVGKAVKLLAIGITIAFLGVMGIVGYHYMLDGLIETSPVLRVPMGWIYAALPFGCALAIVNLLALAFEGIVLGRDIVETDPDNIAD